MPAVLAALLLFAAPAVSGGSAAGIYDVDQMEMAGGLELRPDGRFRYALEYGAVSEQGEGKWRREGTAVLLTSDPMPKAPDFKVVRDDPAPLGELTVSLEPPGFGSMGSHVDVLFKSRRSPEIRELELDESGRAQFASGMAELIIPEVPVYGGLGTPIPLSPDRGHRLLLRFLPNDLGKARFNGEKLTRDAGSLVLYRYDARIVFHPRPR
jgi:hypothetical protein